MRKDQAFKNRGGTGKNLRVDDIRGKGDVPVIIESVEQIEAKNGETYILMKFKDQTKGLTINKTNWEVLESCLGDDSDMWIGKQVFLWVDESVEYEGRRVGGIRFKMVSQQYPQGAAAQINDDDIPFDHGCRRGVM